MKKRVILIVLDSVGAGELPDAAQYGDVGSCTWGHVVDKCKPSLPNMAKLGMGHIEGTHYPANPAAIGAFGRCMEASAGKDTTTGHWELAGCKLDRPFPTFTDTGFPEDFIARYEAAIGTKVIGNYASSGTVILDELGEEHMRTRSPIVYTSADSVFQIACHEEIYSREELYELCRIAREMLTGDLCVGRVIARPFIGEPGNFTRTANRRDFSVLPPRKTVLEAISEALGVNLEYFGFGGSAAVDLVARAKVLFDSDISAEEKA